jgi:hypothetical protein
MLQIETCEYVSIVKRAGQEGWLQPLTEAHAAPCSRDEAMTILGLLRNLPAMKVLFRSGARGRARFSRRTKRYGMTLSSAPGGRAGRLRAGLVLHEAAHILAHLETGKFDHQENYCRTLRRLLQTDWRTHMPTSSFAAIYNRHRGQRYSLALVREIDHGGKRGKEQISDRILLPLRDEDEGRQRSRTFTAEEAHEEARMLVGDPRENVKSVFVFGETENQFIGAAYHRGETYLPWSDETLPVDPTTLTTQEIADEVTSHPRVEPAAEPTKPATDWQAIGKATKEPKAPKVPRKAGLALTVAPGSEAKWPPAPSAQHILATFKARGAMTAKEAAEVLAPKLVELGVAHPASAVSRLKQAGLLQEVAA